MTIIDMLGQSGVLTLLGMGVVFGFLIIMVISITVVGKFIRVLGLDKDISASSPVLVAVSDNAAVTAAISAAVSEYQKNESR